MCFQKLYDLQSCNKESIMHGVSVMEVQKDNNFASCLLDFLATALIRRESNLIHRWMQYSEQKYDIVEYIAILR